MSVPSPHDALPDPRGPPRRATGHDRQPGERTNEAGICSAYIRVHVIGKLSQDNPAPGAARDREKVLTKRSWADKYDDMVQHFKACTPSRPPPCAMSLDWAG